MIELKDGDTIFVKSEDEWWKLMEYLEDLGYKWVDGELLTSEFITRSVENGGFTTVEIDGGVLTLTSKPSMYTVDQVISEEPKKIDKGNWYISENERCLVYATKSSEKGRLFSGFGLQDNMWVGNSDSWVPSSFSKASDDYVVKHIREYAESKYNVGDKVRCLHDRKIDEIKSFTRESQKINIVKYGEFWITAKEGIGIFLMKDGKWAEVVDKKEKPTQYIQTGGRQYRHSADIFKGHMHDRSRHSEIWYGGIDSANSDDVVVNSLHVGSNGAPLSHPLTKNKVFDKKHVKTKRKKRKLVDNKVYN